MAQELFQEKNVGEDTQTITVLEGLRELGGSTYSVRQNLEARLAVESAPEEADSVDLLNVPLDSRTMVLYGGVNSDGRHRFKISHDVDIGLMVGLEMNEDGSLHIFPPAYHGSDGTEFVIITASELDGAKSDYAIRADNYGAVREQLEPKQYGDEPEGLGISKYKAEDLEKAGGFKIGVLTAKEVETHDGWLELVEGDSKLLGMYIAMAKQNGVFPGAVAEGEQSSDGKGMAFFVKIGETGYAITPLSISAASSDAVGRGGFKDNGSFLRAHQPT